MLITPGELDLAETSVGYNDYHVVLVYVITSWQWCPARVEQHDGLVSFVFDSGQRLVI